MNRPRFFPRFWRVRTRILGVLLTMTLLPFLIVEVLSIRQSTQTLTNTVRADYAHTAASRAALLADHFAEQVRLATLLANNSEVIALVRSANSRYASDPVLARAAVAQAEQAWPTDERLTPAVLEIVDHPVSDHLRAFQALVPGITDVLVTDASGAVAASTRQLRHLDMFGEAWWQDAWDSGPAATSLRVGALDRAAEGQGLLLTLPIVSTTTDQTIGVLRISYAMRFIAQDLATAAPSEGPETLIVSGDQQVLASTNVDRVGQPSPISLTDADAADGDLFVATSALPAPALLPHLDTLGWQVVVLQQRAVALAPVNTQVLGAMTAGIVILLASLGAAWLVGQWLARPLADLASVTEAGDLTVLAATPSPIGGDEVRVLARSLQQLSQHVRQSQADLAASNSGLEATIAARMTALHHTVQSQQALLTTQQQLLTQIAQMETPVLPIIPGVVVIPLIGRIDAHRAQVLTETLLPEVERAHARVILLDLTGVPMMDMSVATALLNTMQAAQLLGAQTILVGIRPEIAQMVVSIGVLRDVTATASLREGLRLAQQRIHGEARTPAHQSDRR